MHMFTLNVITSGRKEIIVKKDTRGPAVLVTGIDPETLYSAQDTKQLAALFAGVEKLLTD